MKKQIIVVFIIVVCLLTVGCGKDNNSDLYDNIPSGSGEVPLTTIEDYEEYQHFLKNANIPNNFVSYDAISSLGEFDVFVCLSDARQNDYSSYMYSLTDSLGVDLSLYIESVSEELTANNVIHSANISDMRRLESKESGVYTHNNICYRYVSGELLSVSWQINGIEYRITGSPMLSSYPDSALSTVGKLLNVEYAENVVDTIMQQKQG